jgi:hypothetical protein
VKTKPVKALLNEISEATGIKKENVVIAEVVGSKIVRRISENSTSLALYPYTKK